jgi:hypothetical protein
MNSQANQCATFEHYTFNYQGDKYTEFLGFGGNSKSKDFAHNFSLLHAYILIPFIFLLIHENPKITDSWLINFELYDRYGKLKGLKKTGNIWIATSNKRRKGKQKAQQDIELNPTSKKLFDQIIALTSLAREWLKGNDNDSWRYLFISCNRGFTKPKRIKQFNLFSFLKPDTAFSFFRKALLEKSTYVNENAAKSIVDNLNFSSMRNSCALQIFLQTRSVKKMSEALGHEEYNPKLLSHYLPPVILNYFYSRWMRIFQTALIYDAIKKSDNVFNVLPFSPKALDKFIKNHGIKNFPELTEIPPETLTPSSETELRIPLSFNLLLVLHNIVTLIEKAEKGQKITAIAATWYKFGKYVIGAIELDQTSQDISNLLDDVRSAPSIEDKLLGAVYEKASN